MNNADRSPDDVPVSRISSYTVNVNGDILFCDHTGLIAGENNIPKTLLAGRAFDLSVVPQELRNSFNRILLVALIASKGLGPDRDEQYAILPVWINECSGMKSLCLIHYFLSINDELGDLEFLQLEDVVFEDREIAIDAILKMPSLKKLRHKKTFSEIELIEMQNKRSDLMIETG